MESWVGSQSWEFGACLFWKGIGGFTLFGQSDSDSDLIDL